MFHHSYHYWVLLCYCISLTLALILKLWFYLFRFCIWSRKDINPLSYKIGCRFKTMIFLGIVEAVLFTIAIVMINMTHNIRNNAKVDLEDVDGGSHLYLFCVVVGIMYMIHGLIFVTFYVFYFSFILLVYIVLKLNNSFKIKDENAATIVEKTVTHKDTGDVITSKIVKI